MNPVIAGTTDVASSKHRASIDALTQSGGGTSARVYQSRLLRFMAGLDPIGALPMNTKGINDERLLSLAKEKRREKRIRQRERKSQRNINALKNSPEALIEAAKELLAQGFLNEALARGKRTSRAGDFYKSREWSSARYAALIKADGACQCCGARASDGAVLHVDHKKPRSKFPQLALELSNLQVLCDLCNIAKSNIDMTDWSIPRADTGAAYREYRDGESRIVRLLKGRIG